MSLRFAILKTVTLEGKEDIALEYEQDQVRDKLIAGVRRNLLDKKGRFLGGFDEEDIIDSVVLAFNHVVSEFKEESIRVK